MNGSLRFVLAAVAVAAVALGGLYLFNRPPDSGIGRPAASPSPTPTPMPFPTDTSGGVPVVAGTYALDLPTRTSTGAPAPLRITFTVPVGWEKNVTPTTLWHAMEPRRFGFLTVDNLYVDPCGTATTGLLDPPLGPTVSDLATGLGGLPDLTSTAPTDVTFGGFSGKQLELTAPTEWPTCVDTYRSIWSGPQGAVTEDGGSAMAASETSRWLLLDVDGVRLAIGRMYHRDTPSAGLAEMQAIVDSIRVERLPATSSDPPDPSPS